MLRSDGGPLPPGLVDQILAGRLDLAAEASDDPSLVSLLTAMRTTIGSLKTVRLTSGNPDVALACTDILVAVAGLSRNWVANTPPLPVDSVPETRDDLVALLLALLVDDHYYHAPPVAGEMAAYPHLMSADYLAAFWDLLEPELPALDGASVLEVGPAEGTFSIALARRGARVTAIERNILMALRWIAFVVMNNVRSRVTISVGAFDTVAPMLKLEPDIVLALGLIYHLEPLEANLELLVGYRKPIAFEFMAADPDTAFDPAAHCDTKPVPLPWLTAWLDARGFRSTAVPAWNAAAAKYSGGAHTDRELLVAFPA